MPPGRSHPNAGAATDDGFSLLEMVVALAVIGVMMGALSTFFVSTMSTVSQQSGLQTAVQLASDKMEQIRTVDKASQVTSASDEPERNGVGYDRSWQVRRCWQPTSPRSGACTYTGTRPATGSWADFIEVTVWVQWPDRTCAGPCSYRTSTLISRADLEPVFNVGGTS